MLEQTMNRYRNRALQAAQVVQELIDEKRVPVIAGAHTKVVELVSHKTAREALARGDSKAVRKRLAELRKQDRRGDLVETSKAEDDGISGQLIALYFGKIQRSVP